MTHSCDTESRLGITNNATNITLYAYDRAGQLTNEVRFTNGLGGSFTSAWQYDESGNWLNSPGAGSKWVYNSDNELMARADGSAQNWSTTVTGTVEPGPNSNKWYNTWATCRGIWERVNPTNGTFSLPGVMLYPGSNVLDVAVVDVSGNVAHQTRSVFKTITNCFETFYHDNNGNMTNWINGGQNVVSQWDWADRLVKVTANGSVRVQNWYDASSRRIGKQEYGQTGRSILYVYDGWEIVGVLNANGSLLETFTRGVGLAGDIGTLVAATPHTSASYPFSTYTHHNHRGDIFATRNGANTIGTFSYTAFGALSGATGPDTSRFKFSSKEKDVSTDLYYYGNRFYSPQWQRWLNRDPIWEKQEILTLWELIVLFNGANTYGYCGNDAVNYFDVEGYCKRFVSQWPATLQKIGENINGKPYPKLPGKATAHGALITCRNNCATMYGVASENVEDECKSCKKQCDSDCYNNFRKALGLKVKGE